MTPRLRLALPCALALPLALGACNDEPDPGSDDGVTSLGSDSASTLDSGNTMDETADDGMDSATLDEGGMSCMIDGDCPGGQICLAASKECALEGGCLIDGDCPEGQVCQDGACMIGGDCGGFEFVIEAVPPNLLILLDRSGSMSNDVPNANGNRWEVAKQAINLVTNSFNDEIRFGLATYSACLPGGCSPGSVVVPIADQNAGPINGFLDMTVGEGSNDGQNVSNGKIQYLCDSGDPETSTGASLGALVGNASLQDPERDNAVLLITDGEESGSCVINGVDGPTGAANLFGQAIPVKTFAVGFGGADINEVNNIAQAGGTQTGYLADQAAELEMALDSIANAVATCTFELDQIPPDPNEIYVFFDKDPAGVPMDPNDGWTYDPNTNTITFHGPACDAIKNGTVVDIDIVYGCDEPPIG